MQFDRREKLAFFKTNTFKNAFKIFWSKKRKNIPTFQIV